MNGSTNILRMAIALAVLELDGRAQLQLLQGDGPARIFPGQDRTIPLVWRNAGNTSSEVRLRMHVLQTSSATAAPKRTVPWKTVQLLPRQTVLDTALLDFPDVRGETRFRIQWLDPADRVLGTTDVLVYPTNLLHELEAMTGGHDALGLLDPQGELKPLLRRQNVPFIDLGDTQLDQFGGKLAIIAPSNDQIADELAVRVRRIARKGVAVVWIAAPENPCETLEPSFYSVREGSIAIVVAQRKLIAGLPENPLSQRNLIRLCRLAMKPEPLGLPAASPEKVQRGTDSTDD